MSEAKCKDCGASISWIKRGEKWVPLDPGSEKRHVCDLDQYCEVCEKIFKGSNYMKVCPECYRNRPKPDPAPRREPPAREPLTHSGEDDDPF